MRDILWCLSVVFLTGSGIDSATAGDYLSSEEVAAISTGTAGMLILGCESKNFDVNKASLWKDPLPFERKAQRLLGGRYFDGKTNFLDSEAGSMTTPVASGILLAAVTMTYPRENKQKELSQDLFLFSAGALANSGLTGLVKGLVARPRPAYRLHADYPTGGHSDDPRFDRQSFYSGHSSGAFFAVSYLNLRLRSTMRHEMSNDEYRRWRWAPPTVLYGWAAFVAWSRLHAYRHYLSDVAVGALAGYLMAELFFSFNDNIETGGAESGRPPVILRVTLPL